VVHRGSSKRGGEFFSWGFLSCELGHKWQFTILLISWIWMAQGSSQFIPLILLLWVKWQITILLISWIWVAQDVVLISSIIFIFGILFNYVHFRVFANFWRPCSSKNSSKSFTL